MKNGIFAVFVGLLLVACTEEQKKKDIETPAQELYGQLFTDVMSCDDLFGEDKLFADSKAFLDLIPKRPMKDILADYQKLSSKKASTLKQFLEENFSKAGSDMSVLKDSSDIDTHIKKLWVALRREPDNQKEVGTLIPLAHSYQVPGGRFTEIYYWDSYFTMLGLMEDGEEKTFIPNGNRTYYLSRSQPPFFSYMVELLAKKDKSAPSKYFSALEKEYEFWMNGKQYLTLDKPASEHCVRMPNGAILNRYYDKYDTPRDEMYRNDLETGKTLEKTNPEADIHRLYRDLRAGAESGWDFSSRWLVDYNNLSTIHTTDIVPIDLNCLMYHLEELLSDYAKKLKKKDKAEAYKLAANSRKAAIQTYFWSEKEEWFMDYDYKKKELTGNLNIAGIFPLYVDVASNKQAKKCGDKVEKYFLKAGGVVTTLYQTGQQWDSPNGWAPLQWITYQALKENGRKRLAHELKERWMGMVEKVYNETFKLLEKYDVVRATNTGGGEYANQDGFGWTNGVYRAMKK